VTVRALRCDTRHLCPHRSRAGRARCGACARTTARATSTRRRTAPHAFHTTVLYARNALASNRDLELTALNVSSAWNAATSLRSSRTTSWPRHRWGERELRESTRIKWTSRTPAHVSFHWARRCTASDSYAAYLTGFATDTRLLCSTVRRRERKRNAIGVSCTEYPRFPGGRHRSPGDTMRPNSRPTARKTQTSRKNSTRVDGSRRHAENLKKLHRTKMRRAITASTLSDTSHKATRRRPSQRRAPFERFFPECSSLLKASQDQEADIARDEA